MKLNKTVQINSNKTIFTEIISCDTCNLPDFIKKNFTVFKSNGTLTPWYGDDLSLYEKDQDFVDIFDPEIVNAETFVNWDG